MESSRSSDVVNVLAGLRLFVGVASWLAPSITSVFSAMGRDLSWKEKYLWRIFGVRDAVLAIGVLTSEERARRHWVKAALVSDFMDGAASVIGGRKAGLSLPTQALHSAPGAIGTILGVVALVDERRAAS